MHVASGLFAQDEWLSPEIKALYTEADKAMNARDYNKAINIYFQAIRLQPGNLVLRRDLAYAYYLSGRYSDGISVLEEIRSAGKADPETYQLLSALVAVNGDKKKAARLIEEGLKKYPNSGVLHYAKGNSQLGRSKQKDALKSFVQGIEREPEYAGNYLAAAKLLIELDEPIWAIIYSEIFINLEPESAKTIEAKKILFNGYNKLYSAQNAGRLPNFTTGSTGKKSDFGNAATGIYLNNYLTVASGMTVESLTMLRVRFLLDWTSKYSLEDHSLLAFHDKLIRNGHFEAYNQFLLGSITNSAAFSTWMQRNAQAMKDLNNFIGKHPYRPSSTDPHIQL